MDKVNTLNSKSDKLYNISYYDDYNKKHLSFGIPQKDLPFYYDRYGKNNVKTINFVTL